MKISNCYEAINEMKRLSNELELLFKKNLKMDGKLESGINSVERDFLSIKHSLDLIQVSTYNKTAYQLGLDMVSYKNELDYLLDKKQYEQNKDSRRFLSHKIDEIESKYFELEKVLAETQYVKNLKFV